jgi:hypothetical protein
MTKPQLNNKGFGLIGVLVIIVVLCAVGGAGVYVYHKNHKAKVVGSTSTAGKTSTSTKTSTPPAPNPYAGWKTCDDTADGVSFKYPSSWTVQSTSSNSNPCDFTLIGSGQELFLQSPSSSGLLFQLHYSPTTKPSNTISFGADIQEVQTVTPFVINNDKTTVNLVSYRDKSSTANSTMISDMGLSDQQYSVGQTFTGFNGVKSPEDSSYDFMIGASLATSDSQYVQSYTPAQYQAQPSYDDLMNIFKSITY